MADRVESDRVTVVLSAEQVARATRIVSLAIWAGQDAGSPEEIEELADRAARDVLTAVLGSPEGLVVEV